MSDPPASNDIQAAFAAVLVDEWLRAGVSDAVLAPGSRSTPMLVALAERSERGDVRAHVVLDERSAGFVGLGLGKGSGRPSLVVTTSGTAAAELHPAIVEADQAGVPLIAITADRPPELHGCGAPQTVPQAGLFGTARGGKSLPGYRTLLQPLLGARWRRVRLRRRSGRSGLGRSTSTWRSESLCWGRQTPF